MLKDILLQPVKTPDWKTILITTDCCVKIETLEQLEQLAEFTGFKNHTTAWLDTYKPLMVYSKGRSKIRGSYSSLRFAKKQNYTIYEFSDIFPSQPIQEPSMPKYKVGDTFRNSKGSICTILSVVGSDTYNYKSLGCTYITTTQNIDKNWIKFDASIPTESATKPTYKVGDKVVVRSDLTKNDYYFMYHNSSTRESVTNSMCKLAGKVVTITAKYENSGTFKWFIKENDCYWTDEMFAGLASDNPTLPPSVPLYLDREPQAGDYVHRCTRHLTATVFGTCNSLNTFYVTETNDYSIYLTGNDINSDSWDIDKFKVINPAHPDHPNYDTTTTAPVAPAPIAKANPKPTPKDKPMAKTLKDNINTQITEVKGAAVNAAELKAGQLINKQAIKLIKPQLPIMVRGFADHPAASVVLANVIGLALKQYAPENPKLAKISNLMLNAAAFDTIDSFNIDEMVDKLIAGIKLPAGVSLDDE